jgi:hypothetical protein
MSYNKPEKDFGEAPVSPPCAQSRPVFAAAFHSAVVFALENPIDV